MNGRDEWRRDEWKTDEWKRGAGEVQKVAPWEKSAVGHDWTGTTPWLAVRRSDPRGGEDCRTHLRNHHVAVERSPAVSACRAVNMRPDLADNGSTECHVRHEMAVHMQQKSAADLKGGLSRWGMYYVDVKPVGSLIHGV